MTTDRELLELAAKAAGMKIDRCRLDDPIWRDMLLDADHFKHRGQALGWNPLTDDGDRYRLARKLGISIDFEDCCAWTRKHGSLIQEFWGGDCPDEAHVIVGVAALIGRRM